MYKALLINPEVQQITYIQINDFEDINKAIGSSTFTIAHRFKNGDSIFVDDEGLLKPRRFGFSVKGGYQELFVGMGVVLGGDNDTGESKDVQSDLIDIADSITFINLI